MARRKKHEEHENHERWLVSYADFITLLFAFFVVMYSVSAVNEGKFRVLSEALAAAFRSQPKSLEPIQVGKPAKSPRMPQSKFPTKAKHSSIIVAPSKPINVAANADLPKSKIVTSGGGEGGASSTIAESVEKALNKMLGRHPLPPQDGETGESDTPPQTDAVQAPDAENPKQSPLPDTEKQPDVPNEEPGSAAPPQTPAASPVPPRDAAARQALARDLLAGNPALRQGLQDEMAASALDQAVEGIVRGMARIADDIESSMAELMEEDLVLVRRDANNLWLEVEIKSSILFGSGDATLNPDAMLVLLKIAETLRGYPYPITVEGFTDNVPINTPAFPSNWELSAARAASVVHLFMDAGIEPERMSAVGYGEHRPVASNATAGGRAKNRRVVLVILADADARRILQMQRQGGGPEKTAEAAPARPLSPAPAAGTGPASKPEPAVGRTPPSRPAPAPEAVLSAPAISLDKAPPAGPAAEAAGR